MSSFYLGVTRDLSLLDTKFGLREHRSILSELFLMIDPELQAGETLLWSGKPTPAIPIGNFIFAILGLVFVYLAFGTIIFSMIKLFFVSLASSSILEFLAGIVYAVLFGFIPLLLVAINLRLLFTGLTEQYYVTDRRIIIDEKMWPKQRHEISMLKIIEVRIGTVFFLKTLRVVAISEKRLRFFKQFLSRNGNMATAFEIKARKRQYFLKRLVNPDEIKNIITQNMRTLS